DQRAQEVTPRPTLRRKERGELRFAEPHLEMASLGNFERVPQPVGMALAGGRHFSGEPEMESAAKPLLRVLLSQERPRADALHDVVLLPVLARGVVNRRGR